ncbi:MAG: cyclodeaminase/cyclohydrolase family protein [Thermoplasmata archaeon]|nr:cyclodeaminase/cyclohydrolase family protein [Thermoplasmata archaeon]
MAPSPAASPTRLADRSLTEFCSRLAARTPTPGGGSAAAAAGAMGVALGEMVLRYSQSPTSPDPTLSAGLADLENARAALVDAIDADTQAFEGLRAARRLRKAAPDDPFTAEELRNAVRHATEVPLATARTARSAARTLRGLRPKVRATIASDLATALALLEAAVAGALANVQANLPDLEQAGGDSTAIRAEAGSLGPE